MAKKSSKAQSVIPVSLKFNGGLNLSDAPSHIADNEVVRALNFLYNCQTGVPETRPGTTCVNASTALAGPILSMHYYEKDASHKWLVLASNGKLYYLSTDTFVEIGALTDSTTAPSFVTFNTTLIIADGGSALKTWDGSTYTTIADSPDANAVKVSKNRLICNSVSENDAVYLSGPKDEKDWDTSGGNAIGLRAGFGDNMYVIGFEVMGDDIIISKRGDSEKRLYRLNTADPLPANWFVSEMSSNNAAQNAHSTTAAFNNIFFVDSNGFKSIRGVTEYGDLQTDLIGGKINAGFAGSVTCDFCTYVPLYTAIWFGVGTRVYAYHRLMDVGGSIQHAFSDLIFEWGRVRSMCQAGSTVYLGGHNGFLYKLDTSASTDEIEPSTTKTFISTLRSKELSMFGEGILRKSEIYLTPITSGAAVLSLFTSPETSVGIKSITLRGIGEELADATGDLEDATESLFDMGISSWYETSHNRARGTSFQFQLSVSSGRVGVNGIKAEIAPVEG